ncbi:hypothetical protein AURDEDRAFT_116579 [Auricularia subglabra TFB-10046 SS5]|nr:hypothetical protein AURDEDRAFT_116579 [Auricularia subglabra TFB-10046 SS5]
MARAWPKLRSLVVHLVSRQPVANPNASPRFNSLTEVVCGTGGHYLLQNYTPVQMPVLRDLSFFCHSAASLRAFASFLSSGPCTSLLSLDLSGYYAEVSYATFAALPNLTTLHLRGLSSEVVLKMFSDWASTDLTLVHPPRLRHLHLTDCDLGDNALHALLAFVEARKLIQSDAISVIRELVLVQTERYDFQDIFEPWMTARVLQLVEKVIVDTSRARPSDQV